MTTLSASLLREGGYERHTAPGFVNVLGVSVQDSAYTLLHARWDIYCRGVLGRDPDAEAISVLVLEELLQRPLHRMTDDPFDLAKRARSRMQGIPNCQGTLVAIDLGGSDAGGEGYLLGSQIREEMREGVFPLRTVSDADLPAPTYDSTHRAWRMSPEALTGALAARAAARQVLISDDATLEARRVLTDALRQAGSVDPRAASPLARLVAWVAEICMRPLVRPLVDVTPGIDVGRQETGRYIRMGR